MIKSLIKKSLNFFGLELHRAENRKNGYFSRSAWEYQSPYVLPHYKDGDLVIDIGCGGAPSPLSMVLTDFFPDESIHRARPVIEDRPLIVCSADRMPVRDKFFDLSICSHVLEHVPSPAHAAEEIGRISKKGYLETPSYGKDILIGTGHQHIWQVVNSSGVLHFFPYTQRQHQAHSDSPLMGIWCQDEYHPWQEFFWSRQDVFNAIQFWQDEPKVKVHGLKQTTELPVPVIWNSIPREKLPNIPPSLTSNEIELLAACLVTPDGQHSMRYDGGNFVGPSERIVYPVRGKRVYFEIGKTG